MNPQSELTAAAFWTNRERDLADEINRTPDWFVIYRSMVAVVDGDWQIDLVAAHRGTRMQVRIRDRGDWEHFRRVVAQREIPRKNKD